MLQRASGGTSLVLLDRERLPVLRFLRSGAGASEGRRDRIGLELPIATPGNTVSFGLRESCPVLRFLYLISPVIGSISSSHPSSPGAIRFSLVELERERLGVCDLEAATEGPLERFLDLALGLDFGELQPSCTLPNLLETPCRSGGVDGLVPGWLRPLASWCLPAACDIRNFFTASCAVHGDARPTGWLLDFPPPSQVVEDFS